MGRQMVSVSQRPRSTAKKKFVPIPRFLSPFRELLVAAQIRMLLVTRGACSPPINMRNEGSHFWIWDRLCSSHIQFVLCGGRKVKGTGNPIPLRERTALKVVGQRFCGLIDRVGAPVGDYWSDWLP